ncbi:MAG: aldo/keto reductase [Lachnospiraceae bacterium]
MKYVKLGRSGMEVSRISMGTHHLDHPEDISRHAENLVYAYRRGINFFETSVSYGEGCSELIIGEAVKEMKKGKRPFYIMSKTHYADHAAFRRDLEASLKRLQVSSIDAFTCLWGVKSYQEWAQARKYGAVDEILKAKEEGLIKYVAISTHMKNEDLLKVADEFPFDLNVIGFNVINAQYRMDGLRASYDHGIGNIAMTPLGTGDILRYPEIFRAVRLNENQSLVKAAYQYLLSIPYIHSVLGAFNDRSQIDEAAEASETCEPYSEADLAEIQKRLRENIAALPLELRYQAGKAIRQRPYILREEVGDLFQVSPLSV